MAISFSILTNTPAGLRDQLIARDIIQEVTIDGKTKLVGKRGRVEWMEVTNPIVAEEAVGEPDDPDYVPAVMDTRHVYLVRLSHAAEANETDGLSQEDEEGTMRSLIQRTKLGQWVLANSVPDTLQSADGRSWNARKVGNNFWLTLSDDFGAWQ